MVPLSPAIFMNAFNLISQVLSQTKLSSMINGRELALLAKGAMAKSTGLLILPLGTFSL